MAVHQISSKEAPSIPFFFRFSWDHPNECLDIASIRLRLILCKYFLLHNSGSILSSMLHSVKQSQPRNININKSIDWSKGTSHFWLLLLPPCGPFLNYELLPPQWQCLSFSYSKSIWKINSHSQVNLFRCSINNLPQVLLQHVWYTVLYEILVTYHNLICWM